MCELDVQATRDGAIVVIHDETVDRTTDGLGAVTGMTLAEIKQLDAGVRFGERYRGERIPTLEEVIEALRGRLGLNVEVKQAGLERKVCELMRAHGAGSASIVSSFEESVLRRVRKIAPELRIGLLAESDGGAVLEAASAMAAYAVNPRFDMVDAAFCEQAHARGLAVLVWTVDAPEVMRLMIGVGVDGIMTNYPERLREVLKAG
jgi:glycerophosphoryl diester phosphodiesterase